ncbi:MAG: hypothetical protein ACJA08_001837 [Cyclobacteriaceae bacterium]|jgi:hypothetical protein
MQTPQINVHLYDQLVFLYLSSIPHLKHQKVHEHRFIRYQTI